MALNLVCAVLDRGPADLAEMAVLLAIADSADKDTGEAWPSQKTVALRSRQSDRNVRNVLERLRTGGWLTWEKRLRANGSQASNLYIVDLERLGEGRRSASPPPERASAPPRKLVPPPPERASGHGVERASALEPSHKKEPYQVALRSAVRQTSPVPAKGQAAIAFVALNVADLSAFDRSRVRSDQSLMVGGVVVLPGSPLMSSLRQALRAQDAGEQGRRVL